MIEKIQDDIFKFKRELYVAQLKNDELEIKRLQLCIKRRIVKLYQYNLEQLKKIK
jgi:hypothetical protein